MRAAGPGRRDPDDAERGGDEQGPPPGDRRAARDAQPRPAIVINDPDLSASQPEDELAASAANSLAHAVEGAVTVNASPVPVLAAHEAIRLTEAAYRATPDREALALAALLSGYTIDHAGLGLHHVLCQTLVRLAGGGHGPSNAAMLPHTIGALRKRNPATVDATALARDLAGARGPSGCATSASTGRSSTTARARRPSARS